MRSTIGFPVLEGRLLLAIYYCPDHTSVCPGTWILYEPMDRDKSLLLAMTSSFITSSFFFDVKDQKLETSIIFFILF